MTSPTGKKNRSRGFLLIEVLVAFAIVALSVTACFHGLAQTLKASRRVQDNHQKISKLQNQLFLEKADQSGFFHLTLDELEPDFYHES